MPISDDIKKFYPDNWQEIRENVLTRATIRLDTESGEPMPNPDDHLTNHAQCEWCGAPNGEGVFRLQDDPGSWSWAVDPSASWYGDGGEFLGQFNEEGVLLWCDKPTKIVLTIAHLDHDPRCDDPERLRALCQRCHLTYDNQPEQRARRKRIYAELRGQQTLLEESR